MNGFPSHMFDRIVRHFLDHTFDPKPPDLTAPRKIIYFCLPFNGIHSLQILSLQDKVPKYLRSSVVYLFKCRCCSHRMWVKPTRHLHTRISEHLGISPITGKHSANSAISSILSHTNTSGHPANFDDFEILSSSDSYELMIHECLLINKYRT